MRQPTQGPLPAEELKLIEASRKIARAIAATSQFSRFEEAKRRLHKDSTAQELLTYFLQAQQQFHLARGWGGASRDDNHRLEQMRQKLLANATLRDYLQAQDRLTEVLQELNTLLGKKLRYDFVAFSKPASGCC